MREASLGVVICTVDITPDDFVGLLVHQHRWLALFLAASQEKLRTAELRKLADETLEAMCALRAAQLRN